VAPSAPVGDIKAARSGEQEYRSRTALLTLLLGVNLFVLVAVALFLPRTGPGAERWWALGLEAALLVVSLAGVRLGFARQVAALYCGAQWATLAAIHAVFGIDPGIIGIGMLNMALTAGLTIGPGGGLALAAMTALWVPLVTYLQGRGIVPPALAISDMPERVAAYACCMVVNLFLLGYGLTRLRFYLLRNHRAQQRLEVRVRQNDELAELSELVVRAPTPAALHRGVVERVGAIMPGHQVALYHARRRRYALAACSGASAWPDRLPADLLRELQRELPRDGELTADSLTQSSVLHLDSLGGDGLPQGRAQLIPIRLGEDLSGALVIVSDPDEAHDTPSGLLRTIASLVAAGNDRHAKENELRQAQKMEAVGQLAGGVAHDFNNLLTSVIGSASLARENIADTDKVVRMLSDIERAGEHAAMLTRQMLQFSRRQAIRPHDLCVHDVVDGLDGMLRRLLPETIKLQTKLAAQRGFVHADRHAIEQLVWNLVLNARDAVGDAGRIELGVAVEPAGGEHGSALLTVQDDGCGMDQDTIDHVYEPFFTTKAVGQGTGLGLATVRRVVENLGGEIAIDSRLGKGTRFTIKIPLSKPIEQIAENSVIAERSPPMRREAFPRAREDEMVLLVEDHELVRKSLRALLENAGYRVTCVPDGQAALEELSRRDGISAVVSDVVMPRVTGDELLKVMRRRDDQTPVILLTGYADDRLRSADPDLLKGVPLLDKPVSSAELLRHLRQLIDRRATSRSEWSSPSIRVDSFHRHLA